MLSSTKRVVGYWTQLSLGQVVDSGSLVSQKTYTSQRFTEGPVANWREKIAKSQDATSTYTAKYEYGASIKGQEVDVVWRYKPAFENPSSRKTLLSGNFAGMIATGDVAHSLSATSDAKALAKLYDRIRSTRTTFDGGTFIGELAESVRMLRSPAKSFHKGLEAYREAVRRRAKGVKKIRILHKIVRETWLEYVFGWKPLMNDAKDAVDAVDAVLKRREQAEITSLRASVKEQQPVFNTVTTGDVVWPIKTLDQDLCIATTVVVYRCGMRWETDALRMKLLTQSLRERLGFTWENFIPTVWNLIPTSFVTDYFVNVGDILSASATDVSNVTWCNKTIVLERTRMYQRAVDEQATKSALGSSAELLGVSGSRLGIAVAITRTVDRRSVELSYPQLTFYMPAQDSLRWLNLAALLSSFSTLSSSLKR